MSYYWDIRFLNHLNKNEIKNIVEVGARYGDESIMLSNVFDNAKIYSFECNPLTLETCREKLKGYKNIKFFDIGLGEVNSELPFYSYIDNNDGASSFYKRIDFDTTQKETGSIKITTLSDFMINNDIQNIDLLCMDVQGFEINILKGANELIQNIKYVIMEEPKAIVNPLYLPNNIYSKYINAPSSQEIHNYMTSKGFCEIQRIEENGIEDNVMYKNKLFDRF